MKQILLVSTAGADQPWLADAAAQLAEEIGAEVLVLVVDDVESQRFASLPRAELLREAAATADRFVARIAEHGETATAVTRSGHATQAAIELAEEIDADLIVVGSGHRPEMVERLLGSLALDLIKRSKRQVLVVSAPR